MRTRRMTAATLVAAAITLLVACGQGTSPDELAAQACEDFPQGLPRQEIQTRLTQLAQDQGVDLTEAQVEAALEAIDRRCPELLAE